jgi:dCTP deaminase
MILSQIDIRQAVEAGGIGFDPPLEDKQWGEASVDLRLGFQFTKLEDIGPHSAISVANGLDLIGRIGLWSTKTLREKDEHGHVEQYTLGPKEFVLAMTYEAIKVPKNMIALVEGRSTYARVGLSMHQTAPWIQPGWDGPIVLEIMNNGPIRIALTPLVDRPCQVTFFELKTELPPSALYGARPTDKYQHQSHPLDHSRKSKPDGAA